MKKITLIRHAQLIQPFANYERPDFQTVCKLATDELSPDIDPRAKLLIKKQNLKNIQLILYPYNKRAIQTARLFKNSNPQVKLIRLNSLKEIKFDPRDLVTRKEFNNKGMESIRQALFYSVIVGNKGVEKLEKIYKANQTA